MIEINKRFDGPTKYLVTLGSRFNNMTPNLPVFICDTEQEAKDAIDKMIEMDLDEAARVKYCTVFNGPWTEEEKRKSLRADYSIRIVSSSR